MNEENTTIMPPEKQIVQDDRDARAEELESAFSYDGYQVVRKELPWAFLTPEMCGMCFSVMRRRPGLYPSEPF